jgi:3'(2'), 5'-bisphosphate nucleotidase
VILAPAWDRAFVGVPGEGAWEEAADGARRPVHVSSRASLSDASVLVSRSHAPAGLPALLDAAGVRQTVRHGSSGLKGVLVAIGEHEAYVQPGQAGMRWDACATDAIVVGAGGAYTDAYGKPVDYLSPDIINRSGVLATNGRVHSAMVDLLTKAAASRPPPR